jgi:dipeptidyl aminopeptidase/acylaminoacyl peptidase
MALDSAGRPHIVFSDFEVVKYAHRNGTGWQIETVFTSTLQLIVGSLQVDAADRLHLSYTESTSLRYAYYDGSAWQSEPVTDLHSCWDSSLALDGLERPHISCRGHDIGGMYVKYAYYDGLAWQAELVKELEECGSGTSLALDATGRPHIGYSTGCPGQIAYAWQSGSNWKSGTVATVPIGAPPSLALDKTGLPHIAYFDEGKLQYATLVSDLTSWSKLAFASFRDLKDWELYAAEGDGTSPLRLTDNTHTDSTPEFNRGATQIAFRSDRDNNNKSYRMNADGSGQTRLTNTSADEYQPTWSPSGDQIAFYSYRDGNAEIYVMNADGSNQTRLTSDPAWDGHPTWSPDGSQIAFVSERSGHAELWVMNADGTNQQQLTAGIGYAAYPDWSPDGSRIAFNDDANGDGWLDVALINVDGTGLTHPLGFSPSEYDYLAPAWAPHGNDLAFAKIQWIQYYGNWYWVDAYLRGLDLATGSTYQLTDLGYDWWPDWQTTDVSAPSSQVTTLPAWSEATFPVHWSGTDVGLAGIKSYDVQVRDGVSGTWTDWLLDTEQTSGSFTGQNGHTYYFRSRALDYAYNLEPYSEGDGDASTTVDVTPPSSSASSPAEATELLFLVTWSGSDTGSGIASYDVQVRDGPAGAWTDWLADTTAPSTFYRGQLSHSYYFRCRARDKLGNVEPYPGGDGDTVTHMPQYAVSGQVLGTREEPVALATVGAFPPALNTAISQPGGLFALYFNQAGACAVEASHDSFGPLPPMKAVTVGSTSPPVVLYLPPADDQIADGGFETGNPAVWTAGGELTPTLTSMAHTGDWAAVLGGPVPPPQVTPTPPFTVSAVVTGAGGHLLVPGVAVVVPLAAVSETTTFTVSSVPTATTLPGSVQDVGPRFALTAILTDGTPVTSTLRPLTLTVTYDDGAWQAAQVAVEESLALWYRDLIGANWLPLTGTLDMASNTLTAVTDRLGLFALLGKPYAGPWQAVLQQSVTLTPASESSTLSMLYHVQSADPLSDSLRIVLNDAVQAVTFTLPLTMSGWAHAWWDLSSWSGPTATLQVEWSQGGRDHLDGVVVDEISLGTVTQGAYPIYLPVVHRAP